MSLVRTQVMLEEGQRELAKREAAKRGISLSEFVRKALNKALPVKKKESPARVLRDMAENAVEGLPSDLGSNDNYLYGDKEK